ncbi:nitroreductase family protein [Rossellomorea sp. AcN35-11]|nr:nitroreductase family protein [Rossellomorea aquimaris]WJV29884.1 nitroreductase family protein [Rossellomorea sp. AcN35-11]
MNEFVNDRLIRDYFQDDAISLDVLNKIVNFHQSSNFLLTKDIKSYPYTKEIFDWLQKVENTDVFPNNLNKIIEFQPNEKSYPGTSREFNKENIISKRVIENLLVGAFGRSKGKSSKKYPSAGALYPVMPILLVLKGDAVEGIAEPGSYLFDGTKHRLIQLEQWDSETLDSVLEAINPLGNPLSNTALVYSIDLRRAVTKYRMRGYRHSLIEVGLMAQSFINELHNTNDFNLGQCMWSGFNDNMLTRLVGLNTREAPVVSLQWFGEVR